MRFKQYIKEEFYVDVKSGSELAAGELMPEDWREIPVAQSPTESDFKRILADRRSKYDIGLKSFSGLRIGIQHMETENSKVFIWPGGVFHHTMWKLLRRDHKINEKSWDFNFVWDSEYPNSLLTEYKQDIDNVSFYEAEVLKLIEEKLPFLDIKDIREHFHLKVVHKFPKRKTNKPKYVEEPKHHADVRLWHDKSKNPWKYGQKENTNMKTPKSFTQYRQLQESFIKEDPQELTKIWIDFEFKGGRRVSTKEIDKISQRNIEAFELEFKKKFNEEPNEIDDDGWSRQYDLTIEQIKWVKEQESKLGYELPFDESNQEVLTAVVPMGQVVS